MTSKFTFLNLKVLSRDSVTVSVEAVVYYRVSNPTMAVSYIWNLKYAKPKVDDP